VYKTTVYSSMSSKLTQSQSRTQRCFIAEQAIVIFTRKYQCSTQAKPKCNTAGEQCDNKYTMRCSYHEQRITNMYVCIRSTHSICTLRPLHNRQKEVKHSCTIAHNLLSARSLTRPTTALPLAQYVRQLSNERPS